MEFLCVETTATMHKQPWKAIESFRVFRGVFSRSSRKISRLNVTNPICITQRHWFCYFFFISRKVEMASRWCLQNCHSQRYFCSFHCRFPLQRAPHRLRGASKATPSQPMAFQSPRRHSILGSKRSSWVNRRWRRRVWAGVTCVRANRRCEVIWRSAKMRSTAITATSRAA